MKLADFKKLSPQDIAAMQREARREAGKALPANYSGSFAVKPTVKS